MKIVQSVTISILSYYLCLFHFLQGSSVIRMLRSFIGDKRFQKGLEVCHLLITNMTDLLTYHPGTSILNS